MTKEEMIAKAAALFGQAKAILVNPDAPAEDKAQVEGMIKDAQALKAAAMQLDQITAAAADLPALAETKQAGDARPKAPGEFKRWGDFLHAVGMAGGKQPQVDPRLVWFADEKVDGHEAKDMAESAGGTGGFLVPGEFLAQLQAVQAEVSNVRKRCTIIPMRRRQISLPVLDQTTTTAGIPHWFGGMQFYWEAEAASKTVTEAKFRQVTLTANKLIGYTRASDELLDDAAISLEAFLSGPLGFAGGAAWIEEYCFLQGSGAGQPLGVVTAPATIVEGRAAAGAIGFDDFADMLEDFLPSANGIWMITQSAMSEVIQLNGPAGNPSYIWTANARDGIPGTILGMPVIWTEKLPILGNQGDVLLADWKYYLLGDRQAATVESTRFDRWAYDQTSWRMVHRVDGQPWLSAPLTLQDGTTRVSPFVVLGGAVGS